MAKTMSKIREIANDIVNANHFVVDSRLQDEYYDEQELQEAIAVNRREVYVAMNDAMKEALIAKHNEVYQIMLDVMGKTVKETLDKQKTELQFSYLAESKKQAELHTCITCNKIAGAICLPCKLVEIDIALKKRTDEIFKRIDKIKRMTTNYENDYYQALKKEYLEEKNGRMSNL